MRVSSANEFLVSRSIFFFTVVLFFMPLTFSSTNSPSDEISLFGDAVLDSGSVSLTRAKNCTQQLPYFQPAATASVGRAFYARPIRFLNPVADIVASFSTSFSFTVAGTDGCPFGDGFAFLISSNKTFFSFYHGYMGLPAEFGSSSGAFAGRSSYVAVEFDTSLDANLDDASDNHVGIDVNRVQSVAAVDAIPIGIDLKTGKELTAWIEYRDSEKMISVWVGHSRQIRPLSPAVAAQIDLSKQFREFMYAGFTASNGKGSSVHVIHRWQFRTSFTLPQEIPITEQDECFMCSPEDSVLVFNPFSYDPPSPGRTTNWSVILGGFIIAMILMGAVACMYVVRRRNQARRPGREREICSFQVGQIVPKMISLAEIRSATNGFDNNRIIGEGASAVVYQGTISSSGHVAVKRFNHESRHESSMSRRIPFNTEFTTMVRCLKHRNLVQLLGWCSEGNEMVLVYEYLSNGNLDKILHSRTTDLLRLLTWERRLKIILGVASALAYLHEECENQIIHRDVKACNILLDANFTAKLGDFGLAEVYRHSHRTRHATVPAGTMGYLAPEYAYFGVPTVKTDVYSFGVVVLEVTTGRRPVDEERVSITEYVWGLWEKGAVVEAADSRLRGRYDRLEMERALVVGLACVHPNCHKRPTVREAARMLRGEAPMPVLPARKPTLRIQSPLPEACEDILMQYLDDTPWTTPNTHFS